MPQKLTLKQHRVIRDITQEQMAEKIGVHRNTYVNWEENPENISIKNANKFATSLGISIDDIFFA